MKKRCENMKKINFTFCSFPDFSNNAKAMYEYMKNQNIENYNLSWVVYNVEAEEKLKALKINVVLFGSKEFKKYISKTDVFFTTHCNLIEYKTKKSLYIELWHGISPKSIGYLSHNLSQNDMTWLENVKLKVDFFIYPSIMWCQVMASAFNMEIKRFLPLGWPKLDYYLHSKGKKNLERLLNDKLDQYKKIIYYMPTYFKENGRKAEIADNHQNILNLDYYDEIKLLTFLKQNNYLLVIKRHPCEENVYAKIDFEYVKYLEETDLLKHNLSVNEIMNGADLLISDFSSLGIEFLYLKKPVIYLNRNLQEYSQNRGIKLGSFSFWDNGQSVKNINDFFDRVNSSFETYETNEVLYELLFGNLKNGGAKTILDYFFENGRIKPTIKKEMNLRYFENLEEKRKNEIMTEDIKKMDLAKKEITAKCEALFIEKAKNLDQIEELRQLNHELRTSLNNIQNSRSYFFYRVECKIKRIFNK